MEFSASGRGGFVIELCPTWKIVYGARSPFQGRAFFKHSQFDTVGPSIPRQLVRWRSSTHSRNSLHIGASVVNTSKGFRANQSHFLFSSWLNNNRYFGHHRLSCAQRSQNWGDGFRSFNRESCSFVLSLWTIGAKASLCGLIKLLLSGRGIA